MPFNSTVSDRITETLCLLVSIPYPRSPKITEAIEKLQGIQRMMAQPCGETLKQRR